MASKKRASWSKQKEEFRQQLSNNDPFFSRGLDDAFSHEKTRMSKAAEKKDAARRDKACTSKNRYSTRAEAREAIAACADYGTKGLREYKCPYCGGWHLTHKDQL